ncbi:hypothetical protein FACS1894186_4480 [Alphaproteobacteria bacterium]|nr:hypothetical protein FACS1894186_4480 [Alphaproteobacteria bacterium]
MCIVCLGVAAVFATATLALAAVKKVRKAIGAALSGSGAFGRSACAPDAPAADVESGKELPC